MLVAHNDHTVDPPVIPSSRLLKPDARTRKSPLCRRFVAGLHLRRDGFDETLVAYPVPECVAVVIVHGRDL
jgi:hypothetical protein